MTDDVAIGAAKVGEAEQILKLQYLCYQSEAAIYDDWTLPPLTQTLWQLLQEYDIGEILVARLDREVVGSVRAQLIEGTCHVGRLIVHPRLQGMGIGTQLMNAIEERFAEAQHYELFTGHLSEDNLRLYRRLGYRQFRQEEITPELRMIHLRKTQENKPPQ